MRGALLQRVGGEKEEPPPPKEAHTSPPSPSPFAPPTCMWVCLGVGGGVLVGCLCIDEAGEKRQGRKGGIHICEA
jgi:hypothetical protein